MQRESRVKWESFLLLWAFFGEISWKVAQVASGVKMRSRESMTATMNRSRLWDDIPRSPCWCSAINFQCDQSCKSHKYGAFDSNKRISSFDRLPNVPTWRSSFRNQKLQLRKYVTVIVHLETNLVNYQGLRRANTIRYYELVLENLDREFEFTIKFMLPPALAPATAQTLLINFLRAFLRIRYVDSVYFCADRRFLFCQWQKECVSRSKTEKREKMHNYEKKSEQSLVTISNQRSFGKSRPGAFFLSCTGPNKLPITPTNSHTHPPLCQAKTKAIAVENS